MQLYPLAQDVSLQHLVTAQDFFRCPTGTVRAGRLAPQDIDARALVYSTAHRWQQRLETRGRNEGGVDDDPRPGLPECFLDQCTVIIFTQYDIATIKNDIEGRTAPFIRAGPETSFAVICFFLAAATMRSRNRVGAADGRPSTVSP